VPELDAYDEGRLAERILLAAAAHGVGAPIGHFTGPDDTLAHADASFHPRPPAYACDAPWLVPRACHSVLEPASDSAMRAAERWRVARGERLARCLVDEIIQGRIAGRQAGLDCLEQIVVGVGTLVLDAIHEERRRPVCATLHAALDIDVDTLAIPVLLQLGLESRHIHARLGRVSEQVGCFERLLMFEHPIVDLPEVRFALRRGRLSRLRGLSSVRMFRTRKVAEDKPQLVTEVTPQGLHCWVRAPAERTFEVAVLDQRDSRISRSDRVVACANGHHQMVLGASTYRISHLRRSLSTTSRVWGGRITDRIDQPPVCAPSRPDTGRDQGDPDMTRCLTRDGVLEYETMATQIRIAQREVVLVVIEVQRQTV
jgi:hypothetical protein